MAKQVVDDKKFTGIRLPSNIKPVHYDLWLKPNFSDFTFAGEVKITYQSAPNTDLPKGIVVHANELKIIDGSLKGESSSSPLTTVTYSPATETATLEFQDDILPNGTINLKFTGCLNDKMRGFYKTAFKIGETEVYAATTQFESTDARRSFPCWDEPAIKATFTVTMVYDKYLTADGKQYERVALSNMPEVSRNEKDTEVEVRFDKSPIMSTYLLAYIVGPFEMIESADNRRPIRVYTTPGKKEHGRFALDVACKSLPYYEDYFSVAYPLPKMDLIAIPDFTNGAMENWGLVTYRETCLLYDPANTSTDRKQWIALVVAHELAHQWFGNLVTMEWWTHLWLNEGFASFMEYLCVDHIFPEYDIWSQFVTDAYGPAMTLDALHNSHPIEVPVQHASEIEEIFDDISYSKGASIIRMLYTYIGDDDFRKGMKDYLNKFAYKNALTEDLWDCLEAASNKPVRKLMSCWTAQKGYPWLSVDYSKVGDQVKLVLTQNKFSADGSVPAGDDEASWIIPVSTVSGSNPTAAQDVRLLEGKTTELLIDGVGDSWIKLNPGTIGLYRTAYPQKLASKLSEAVAQQSLPPMDRLGFLSDYNALCQAGKISSVDLLKLLQAFKSETNFTVWSSIDSSVARLSLIISYTDYKELFQAFVRDLYSKIFNKVGWVPQPNEKHTDAMTRALVIKRLVIAQHEDVIQEAKRLFKIQIDGGAAVAADLRAAVYRAVAMSGDDATFEHFYTIYRTAELHEEKSRALQALAFATDSERLEKVIKFGMSSEVRNQDKIFLMMPLSSSNPTTAFRVLRDYKDFFRAAFGSNSMMSRMAKAATQDFASEESALEVEKFFEENKFPGCERSVKQALEKIRLNAKWLSRDKDVIKEFLTSK